MPRPKKNKQAGEAFKKLLKEKGFTQYKLEQVTGLDKGLISKIATGQTAEPKPTTLEKIATALGVELGELTKIFAQPLTRSQSSQSAEKPLTQQTNTSEKITGVSSSSVGVESAIADSASEDIEALVQKVRSHFNKVIQNECETLCTFNLLYTPMRGNLSRIYVQTKLNASQLFGSADFSQERQLWNEVVLRNPKLMVLGKPGAGKTTLLQYIAVHCDEIEFQPKLVPVFVSLKTLAENARGADEVDLLGYICKKYCPSNVSEMELETLLGHGRFIFLLDGLDEVIENKLQAISQKIHKLVDEYGENRFIVSCRKGFQAYQSKQFCRFTFCQVAGFDQQQIEEFIKNWFDEATADTSKKRSIKATQLIEKLRLPENQRIRELADTPLLLHLICLIFQDRGDLLSKRFELYKEGIDLLLEKWNQFNQRTQIEVFTIDLIELRKALKQIAAINFKQGKSHFEEKEIIPFIKNTSSDLSKIEVLSGILVKKNWKIYEFSHQTFQEYLIAEQIIDTADINALKELVSNSINDRFGYERWQEIFSLVSEMFTQSEFPEEKLLGMQKQIICFLRSKIDLQDFVNQAYQKTSQMNNYYKYAAIRAVYFIFNIVMSDFSSIPEEFISYGVFSSYEIINLVGLIDNKFELYVDSENRYKIISDIEIDYRLIRAFEIAYVLADWGSFPEIEYFDYVNIELERNLCFNISLHLPENYKFIESIQKLANKLPTPGEDLEETMEWWAVQGNEWLEEFQDWIVKHRQIFHKSLAEGTLEAAHQYYDINKLLISCLNSGCNISPEVRSHIEDNLFMPLDSSLS